VTLPAQSSRLAEVDWDWVLLCDGGRADIFEPLCPDHLPEETAVSRAYNGGVGYTADWMAEMFPDSYEGLFVHGGQPIHSMQGGDWDEREHFGTVPHYTDFEWDQQRNTCPPAEVNRVVRSHLSDHDGGVVRYLQPHPPFRQLPERTKGRSNPAGKPTSASPISNRHRRSRTPRRSSRRFPRRAVSYSTRWRSSSPPHGRSISPF